MSRRLLVLSCSRLLLQCRNVMARICLCACLCIICLLILQLCTQMWILLCTQQRDRLAQLNERFAAVHFTWSLACTLTHKPGLPFPF